MFNTTKKLWRAINQHYFEHGKLVSNVIKLEDDLRTLKELLKYCTFSEPGLIISMPPKIVERQITIGKVRVSKKVDSIIIPQEVKTEYLDDLKSLVPDCDTKYDMGDPYKPMPFKTMYTADGKVIPADSRKVELLKSLADAKINEKEYIKARNKAFGIKRKYTKRKKK